MATAHQCRVDSGKLHDNSLRKSAERTNDFRELAGGGAKRNVLDRKHDERVVRDSGRAKGFAIRCATLGSGKGLKAYGSGGRDIDAGLSQAPGELERVREDGAIKEGRLFRRDTFERPIPGNDGRMGNAKCGRAEKRGGTTADKVVHGLEQEFDVLYRQCAADCEIRKTIACLGGNRSWWIVLPRDVLRVARSRFTEVRCRPFFTSRNLHEKALAVALPDFKPECQTENGRAKTTGDVISVCTGRGANNEVDAARCRKRDIP